MKCTRRHLSQLHAKKSPPFFQQRSGALTLPWSHESSPAHILHTTHPHFRQLWRNFRGGGVFLTLGCPSQLLFETRGNKRECSAAKKKKSFEISVQHKSVTLIMMPLATWLQITHTGAHTHTFSQHRWGVFRISIV